MDKDNSHKQKNKVKRIDAHYILQEIQGVLNIDKGFIFTFIQLLWRPGKAIREYLLIDRTRYVKPIIYAIFSAFALTVFLHYFQLEYHIINLNGYGPLMLLEEKLNMTESLNMVNRWVNDHLGYSVLFLGLLITLWIKLLFYKRNYNIFEIFVLISYAYGTFFILLLVSIIISLIFKSNTVIDIGSIICDVSIVWTIGQFFGEKKFLII